MAIDWNSLVVFIEDRKPLGIPRALDEIWPGIFDGVSRSVIRDVLSGPGVRAALEAALRERS